MSLRSCRGRASLQSASQNHQVAVPRSRNLCAADVTNRFRIEKHRSAGDDRQLSLMRVYLCGTRSRRDSPLLGDCHRKLQEKATTMPPLIQLTGTRSQQLYLSISVATDTL